MEHLKYGQYKRKSSEGREQQALSIESQTEWGERIEKDKGIKIIKAYEERKSAEAPYLRPVFDQLIKDIRAGVIDALIEWKLDRLARNPEEAGIIIGMLKRGEIKHIITSDREYRPEDNAIMSYIDFGMADQFSRDLSKNIKRGQHTKAQKGWRSGGFPLGYLSTKRAEKGTNTIIVDPDRFESAVRILRMFLDTPYSVRQIQRETVKWGLKSRRTKKLGGQNIHISTIYNLLTNVFVTGYFYYTNPYTGEREFKKGEHEPMITPDEFDRIQIRLGHKGKPRPHGANFQPFNGKVECGECGSMVTTDIKYQMICSECRFKFAYRNTDACPKCATKITAMENPIRMEYPYNRCSKKKGSCGQKSIRTEELVSMIDQALAGFKVSDCFAQWALEELAKETEQDVKDHNAIVDSQQQRYKNVVAGLLNLAKLYTSPDNADGSLLSLEEYAPQRKALLAEKKALEEAQSATGRKIEEWIDWTENSFNFAVAARVWFEKGTPEQRRDIFFSLSGSNMILKDKKLLIGLKKPLDMYGAIVSKYPSVTIPLELTKGGSTKEEYLPFAADIPSLRRRRDSNSRWVAPRHVSNVVH